MQSYEEKQTAVELYPFHDCFPGYFGLNCRSICQCEPSCICDPVVGCSLCGEANNRCQWGDESIPADQGNCISNLKYVVVIYLESNKQHKSLRMRLRTYCCLVEFRNVQLQVHYHVYMHMSRKFMYEQHRINLGLRRPWYLLRAGVFW